MNHTSLTLVAAFFVFGTFGDTTANASTSPDALRFSVGAKPSGGGHREFIRFANALSMVKQGQQRKERELKKCRTLKQKIDEQIALDRGKRGAKRMAQLLAQKAQAGCQF